MIDVWIFVFYIGSATVGGGPVVVDNLATEEVCLMHTTTRPSFLLRLNLNVLKFKR